MANICTFQAKVRGKNENITAFLAAMEQKEKVYIGRGAALTWTFACDGFTEIEGECKWSVQSAMIDNALSMQNKPEIWAFFGKGPDGKTGPCSARELGIEILTLPEACARYKVDAEFYSWEPGCQFSEHLFVSPDGILISEQEWQDGYKEEGGFVPAYQI